MGLLDSLTETPIVKRKLYKFIPKNYEQLDILELLVKAVAGDGRYSRMGLGFGVWAWLTPTQADEIMFSFQESGFEFSLETSVVINTTKESRDGDEAD